MDENSRSSASLTPVYVAATGNVRRKVRSTFCGNSMTKYFSPQAGQITDGAAFGNGFDSWVQA
ncbi:MAG: hypothetical protein AAB217_01020 [Chloroflexota bacterium]